MASFSSSVAGPRGIRPSSLLLLKTRRGTPVHASLGSMSPRPKVVRAQALPKPAVEAPAPSTQDPRVAPGPLPCITEPASDWLKSQHGKQQQSGSAHPDSSLPPEQHLRVLFLVNSHGTMSQRMLTELQAVGHYVTVVVPKTAADMESAARAVNPDVILAPFLTKFVPEAVHKQYTTIIVHPGPLGDGGPSSLDWAKRTLQPSWGVTLLEASDAWDGGPVWAHRQLAVPMSDADVTKSTVYRNYLVPAAVDCMWEALTKLVQGKRPLVPPATSAAPHNVPSMPAVHDVVESGAESTFWLCPDTGARVPSMGGYQRKMTKQDRRVDFQSMAAADVAHLIATSDSRPGATATLAGVPGEVYLFNARLARATSGMERCLMTPAKPGDVVGHREGAVLIKCQNGGGVWVDSLMHEPMREGQQQSGGTRVKCMPCRNLIKLPAHQILLRAAPELASMAPLLPGPPVEVPLPFGERPLDTWQEVYLWQVGDLMVVNFDFYNGAMSTSQCRRLEEALRHVASMESISAVVIAGGRSFFSNEIHLNVIEASDDPAQESMRNIVAIDDVVKAVFDGLRNKLVVSAIGGSAGAGGAMMALAADLVFAHRDAVLNPHYQTMHLFGSEYWTHFLPPRVGAIMAQKLTTSCQPVNARQALSINLIDDVAICHRDSFLEAVVARVTKLLGDGTGLALVQKKVEERGNDWFAPAEACRETELSHMRESFESKEYKVARQGFVYKKSQFGEVSVKSPVEPLVGRVE